jgi:predicted enzyme related to lactoylglutathione lyase
MSVVGSAEPHRHRCPAGWQGGRVHTAEFILYVADQVRARDFYGHVLAVQPALDVPGMTEFDLGGATLGLMPAADVTQLLAGRIRTADQAQRCELYLRRADAEAALARAADSGGTLLDALRDRAWGERVGYVLDPDGHVLALTMPSGVPDQPH